MFKKKIKIEIQKLPLHFAFIMDGNGRWAKNRILPRSAGHRAGVLAVKNTIDNALKLNIKYITFYAFSTENWKRPKEEIDTLFNLFREFLHDNQENYQNKDVKVNILGDLIKFPEDLQKSIIDITQKTKNGKALTVNIAFNYGARDEILRAVELLKADNLEINEENFKKMLYTKDIPDPDMIIRTSGEMRLSNFLLFQSAYSELYFIKKSWPDFDYNEFVKAINEYGRRNRRYGAV